MKYYYQLCFTLEKSVRGNYETPHTIGIESKKFLRYILEKNKTISMYFENKKKLYDEMPDNLYGKLIKRKDVIDFMDFTPSCLSLVAMVSYKIKQIFEHLNVSKNEYIFKKISINGYAEEFYLLFILNAYLRICLTMETLRHSIIAQNIIMTLMIIV